MHMKTLAFAASFILSLTGASFAQTPAGAGSAEGNMNNPGSVKSNSEKSMERSTGSATGGAGITGAGSAAVPGASGGPSNATPGAPGGSSSGNAATGTGAAPSGQ